MRNGDLATTCGRLRPGWPAAAQNRGAELAQMESEVECGRARELED